MMQSLPVQGTVILSIGQTFASIHVIKIEYDVFYLVYGQQNLKKKTIRRFFFSG
jgi:hypothetical protein